MRRKAFLDRGGILRVITPCPPLHLEELLACWQLAIQMLGDRCPELTYLADPLFHQLSDRCLRLAGVNPNWCSPELVVRLLYSDAILLHLNRPSRTGTGPETPPEQQIAHLVAVLTSTEGTIAAALDLAGKVPVDRLEAILQARLDLLHPDAAQTSGWQAFMQELEAQPGKELEMDFAAMAAAFGFGE